MPKKAEKVVSATEVSQFIPPLREEDIVIPRA